MRLSFEEEGRAPSGISAHGSVAGVPFLELTEHLLCARHFCTHYLAENSPHLVSSSPRSMLYVRKRSLREIKGLPPTFHT